MLRLRVQLRHAIEECRVRPQSARGGLVGVRHLGGRDLLGGRVFLLGRIHQLAVGLLVPPHEAGVRIQHVRAGVDVADDALAGRDSARQLMRDRMPPLPLRHHRVWVPRRPQVAGGGERAGIDGGTVVGVNHVTRRATARPVVARVVVRAQEIERGVEQPRFLESDQNGVCAVLRAETPRAQSRFRLPIILERVRKPHLLRVAPTALEDAEDVARLADLEAREGVEKRHDALEFHLEIARRRHRLQPLRRPVHAVTFAEPRRLDRVRPIIVKRRPPQHRPMRHHALAILQHFFRVTPRRAATDVRDPQVARVHEPDKFRRLVVEQRIRPRRVPRPPPRIRISRHDVREPDVPRRRVSPMTVGASQPDRLRLSVRLVLSPVTLQTPLTLRRRHAGRLPVEVDPPQLGRHRERINGSRGDHAWQLRAHHPRLGRRHDQSGHRHRYQAHRHRGPPALSTALAIHARPPRPPRAIHARARYPGGAGGSRPGRVHSDAPNHPFSISHRTGLNQSPSTPPSRPADDDQLTRPVATGPPGEKR